MLLNGFHHAAVVRIRSQNNRMLLSSGIIVMLTVGR